MRNIVLVVSYDGTAYHGWQCQPGLATIQQTLQEKIEKIVNHKVKIYGGARTDSGVHAFGQTLNFLTTSAIGLTGLERGLNSQLPPDIRIRYAREEDDLFHARYSAKSKIYIYTIMNVQYNSPFYERYVWHIPYRLNDASMNAAVKNIIGVHDYSAFKKKDEIYQTAVREILKAGVKRRGNFIYVLVEATGFLRYMVRNIVGTLMLVGSNKLTVEDFKRILESKDREKAGPTAPARGLFLREIKY
ncbi:MAG TPA: tRNA pseudouridine(38-40) synthase TruA [Syntrophorhabdaceae bacterium]|jgi:tRNA pseudouridine38-40 synthase|nr:tRNA pseudouridine(38-40) synthase TruA [Syntrophorhabdaceae bacterium]OQC51459.1 MAG: tRNA pseudouridine synthase A [Deltaproteobacteria bacterium ADurb.Bin026]HOF57994.1 tRNA pseudouridine(38-40) synthase TruA [Syntrophorhabdaceae bacterium]HOS05485.1 tRNA pseudouridine(38-40) synthase TruA [Syntrophorhabdaceae bacterium]HPH41172.1 tRNA pseudouridine(38-40) synthase TruA [Syntrophorhabdaceae bacterium]